MGNVEWKGRMGCEARLVEVRNFAVPVWISTLMSFFVEQPQQ